MSKLTRVVGASGSQAKISQGVSLAPLTSWQVGGAAEFFAEPTTESELEAAINYGRDNRLAITFLGGGTNSLISDNGIKGLVIALRKYNQIDMREQHGRHIIEAFAGVSKSELLKRYLKAKLEPAVFLAGIPGDVGGGVVMNAGVGEIITPREFVEITERIEVWKWDHGDANKDVIEKHIMEASELKWTYRHCEGWRPGVITKAWLSWPMEPKDDVLERVRKANHVRLAKQPLDMPSCGSVFANPPGDRSGRLIEACGLKGYSVGGARVSEKHANFIVNTGGATAMDLYKVIRHVQDEVKRQTKIALRTEVVLLGDWPKAP